MDDGFVEFEFIGSKRYMKERAWSRGVNCTSVDAVMIGKNQAGKKIMFLIEWKYTEEYPIENKYIPERASVYDSLIQNPNSPFMKPSNIEVMYYEPFYQLMRQTLLGWQCIINDDHNCSDYFHLHVIPKANIELRNRITSPGCSGKDISEAWKKMLKDPNKYQSIDPADLLKPCLSMIDCKSILTYLQNRYW